MSSKSVESCADQRALACPGAVPETLLTFVLAGVLLVVIPGPSVLFIVGRALAHGRRAALASVAGNTAGASLVVLVVALGFGAVAAAVDRGVHRAQAGRRRRT